MEIKTLNNLNKDKGLFSLIQYFRHKAVSIPLNPPVFSSDLVHGAAAGGAVAGEHLRLVRGQRGVVPRRVHLRRGHHLRGAARQQDGQVRGYFFK